MPAPFFANPKAPQACRRPRAGRSRPVRRGRQQRPPPCNQSPRNRPRRGSDDPIADLIGPSPRIAAVQRALSDYGYGQIRPNGMLDDDTSVAIEKFEREHKMPVTGEISDRLVGELAAMVGHPLQIAS